jgi:hypothetical protein
VVVCPGRTHATLNLSERTLHRRAREIKVSGQLGEGCLGGLRTSAGYPHVQSVRLQKILLQRRSAGSRLPDPSMYCTGEVRSLSIHASIQASTNLAANPARLHLGDGGRCTEPPQQINEHISALPHEQSLATPLATMPAKLISLSEPSKIGRLCRRDIDLKMHAPRGE